MFLDIDIVCNDGKIKINIAKISSGVLHYKIAMMLKNKADIFDFCNIPSSDQKFRVAYNIWKPFVFKRYPSIDHLLHTLRINTSGKFWIIPALQQPVLKFLMELTSRSTYLWSSLLYLLLPGDQAAWPRAGPACGVHPLLVVLGPVGRGGAEVDWGSGQGDDIGLNCIHEAVQWM